ncbi:VWA domain-containing protein [Flavobacterium pectinovorum]|uniref:PKD domain-containing protein n=1 Tax=Flavobacterium pectinovorum TaxID=29533 RepID=UPI00265DE156|nr:PKD domain-containing protein [Flavobacterium pectinovorum]WKL46339.1 VWA domain-containing protein [Flavobacterium pectinovorum]
MVNNLKIKKYWIATLCMVFCSLSSFAQDLSDATIGFDVARIKAVLKERGIKNEDMELQILMARKVQLTQYLEIKQIEDSYLNKIKSGQTNKITAEVPQSEKDALKTLYDVTNGDNWKNKTGWDFNTPVTSWNASAKTGWYGLVVTNGHVVNLGLNNNNLNNGNIAFPDLSALTDLVTLNVSENPLKGSIAPFGSITNLRILTLGYNNFSDTTIPEGLQNLINLDFLALQNMGFSQTSDLVFIANKFPKLKTLNLYINNYSGTLPTELQNLTNLKSIYIEQNKISDISVLGNMTGLANIFLGSNKITSIPSNFSNLINLEQISVGGNQISGTVPSYIQNYSLLRTLWLDYNLFEGKIPDLTNLTKLNNVIINNNKFRFIDFASEFPVYKTRFTYFSYYRQANTDSAETINKATGSSVTLSMSDDGVHRYTNNDKFKWYKGNYPSGILVSQDESRQFTISNLNSSHAGNYYCLSTNSEITNPLNTVQNLVLLREPITLKVINCTAPIGTVTSPTDKFHTNGESSFAFESTATGLTYEWSVTPANGTATSNTLDSYTHTFTEAGDYEVKLVATDANGCSTTFTKPVKVEERYCDKEPIDFAFNTTETNLTYNWTSTDSVGNIVHRETNATGLYTFTPQVAGEYVIELVASSATSCKTLFSKNVIVDQCTPYISCTKDNPLSPEIHSLFINLIGKLASTPTGTNVNVYAHKEIAAVAPYTADKKATIYNFTNTTEAISFSFSATAAENEVYIPKSASGSVTAINLDKYKDALTSTIVATSYNSGATNNSDGHVRNIDFCPKELSCVSHIALVVDESGSLDLTEINKIKKQLKLFVAKQAFTNDDIGSNIHVSITGMSDSDANTRTDFIAPTKMTAGNVGMFNAWIDKLGKRYGDTGISQASDYWKSGLDGALAYTMKPTFVLMITDGSQTANVQGLKETFTKFDNNNKTVTVPKLPHLYVVGIENGNYVDRDSYTSKLSRDLDPNYNPSLGSNNSLTAKTTPLLTKSLQYLLGLSATQFPVSDINQFNVGTYFGHSNFDLLASDETYFADKVVTGEFACGTPAIKDFCDDCFSFKPEPGKEYILSAWVKEESVDQVKTYTNPVIQLVFYNNKEALDIKAQKIDSLSIKASGDIIDGWQRVVQKFKIPTNTITIGIELENLSPSIPVYFDDIRIHPLQGSVKSFVYDPETFKLMSELDENNYSTFYEYDNEGGLVRVKKETAKGVKTIQETRSGNVINATTTNP